MSAAFDKITLADLARKRLLLTSEYDTRCDEIRHLRDGEKRDNPETSLRITKLEEIQRQKEIDIRALNAQIDEIQKPDSDTQPPEVY